MKRIALGWVLPLALLASCSKLPASTSLGTLVRVEKEQSVSTDSSTRPQVTATAGAVLYVLYFEGKSEIRLDPEHFYPLVDSTGKEFLPVLKGSTGSDNRLLLNSVYNGSMTGQAGKWVFTGTETFPQPKFAFVYEIPEAAGGLALKDGDRKISLD